MSEYKVIVTNDILGNSERIMTWEELQTYNVVARSLARKVDKDGKPHSDGMWTVKPYTKESNNE